MLFKEIAYKPQNQGWSGSVTLKVPTYKDRLKMAQQLGISKDLMNDPDKQMALADTLFSKVEEHVSKVDLKWGDEEFKSLEELGYFEEGTEVVNELAACLCQGISLGKRSPLP